MIKSVSTKELKLYENDSSKDQKDVSLAPLSEHLKELRGKIITSILALCISTSIGFLISKNIISLLIDIAPQGTSFLQIRPGEFFFTSIRTAVYAGFAIAMPIIVWQFTDFIMPGLKAKEKRFAIILLAGAPAFFVWGSVFGYYFVLPSMLNFLFGFGKEVISMSISIESYVAFALLTIAICGLTFLFPIITLALAYIGAVNSSLLIDKWRFAILASLILGAILTPTPDPVNMGIVSSILIGLYFFSWGILKILGK